MLKNHRDIEEGRFNDLLKRIREMPLPKIDLDMWIKINTYLFELFRKFKLFYEVRIVGNFDIPLENPNNFW